MFMLACVNLLTALLVTRGIAGKFFNAEAQLQQF
jgi:ABC-type iron transport system FetAB permease component